MTRTSPTDDDIAHLVQGAIDTHMHTAPDAFPRHDTDFSAARKARDHGMRAICIKSHHYETASRAMMASQETGFTVLGGPTLNAWMGGLNPVAVDGATNFDPAIVWLPTITAQNHLDKADLAMFTEEEAGKLGISFLDDDGELVEDALDVIDAIAETDMTVGLSHLSPTEAIAFTEAAADAGVEEFLVQHPHAKFLDYSHDEMRAITDLGATLEFHWICTTEFMGYAADVDDYVAAVDAVGPEHCVMATDGGATDNPPAVEMFKQFVHAMRDAGVPEDDIETMIKDNPRRIFGLD